MANILKDQVRSVDVFLLLFNGGNPRFQASIIQLLKLYESIFSKDMWKNAITEVRWSHGKNVQNQFSCGSALSTALTD